MRERSFTSICACAASWVTFTDCTAWEDAAVTQVPPAATPEAGPAPGPAYPVEQLLWGQNFAIFIQPGEGGGPELPVLPEQAWAAPSPPRLPGQGTGPVTCTSYTAPGANTPSQSLSPPPGLLPGDGESVRDNGIGPRSKPQGLSALGHPMSSCHQLPSTQAHGEKDSGGRGSSH